MLTQYKETEAFLAAFELGIYDLLIIHELRIEELAEKINVDIVMLSLFLKYLKKIDLVQEQDSKWSLTSGFKKEWGKSPEFLPVMRWEQRLKNSWLTVNEIKQSLQKGNGKRNYDLCGMSNEDLSLYTEAMYGKNIKIICNYINRANGEKKRISVLELGRSPGVITSQICKQFNDIEGVVAIYPEFINIAIDLLGKVMPDEQIKIIPINDDWHSKKYDLICINNTIHYWTHTQAEEYLQRIDKCISESGKLVIVDFFVYPEESFAIECLLDWITHGGCNFIGMDDLKELLLKANYKDNIVIKPIGLKTSLIISAKQKKEAQKSL